MANIVTKFGGSSLADAGQLKKVKEIIESNPERRYVVASAPGKRFDEDIKVTDMLYNFHQAVFFGEPYDEIFDEIKRRFVEMKEQLGLNVDIEKHIDDMKQNILNGASRDYVASRGEYLNSILIADYLGFTFVDAAEIVCFDSQGIYDNNATMHKVRKRLKEVKRAVIPGFYGSMPDGSIKTFSRGGSDISGAIIAGALSADLYENWTDVSGFLMADPRIVKDANKIDVITYRELRELSYMGATVLHEDAIFPVFQAAIPINVRNTNDPENSGTMILPTVEEEGEHEITGIAGKKNFTVISIEKNGMNKELGFGRRVLSVLEKFGVSFEHMPSGIDTLCIVVEDTALSDNLNDIIDEIHDACEPDSVVVHDNMALIATVGRGMIHNVGIAAKLFGALAGQSVNIRMIDQGSSEINIIVGVENDDFERAVQAIYNAFEG